MGDENRRFSSKVCGQVAMQPGEGPSDPLRGGLHGAQYAASTFTMLVSTFCSLPSSRVRDETDRKSPFAPSLCSRPWVPDACCIAPR